jgi:hypothetical protein
MTQFQAGATAKVGTTITSLMEQSMMSTNQEGQLQLIGNLRRNYTIKDSTTTSTVSANLKHLRHTDAFWPEKPKLVLMLVVVELPYSIAEKVETVRSVLGRNATHAKC